MTFNRRPPVTIGDEEFADRYERPLGLRLLALVGALSFILLGVSSLVPLLQRSPPAPGRPSQRNVARVF